MRYKYLTLKPKAGQFIKPAGQLLGAQALTRYLDGKHVPRDEPRCSASRSREEEHVFN